MKFGLHASFVELESAKNAVNELELYAKETHWDQCFIKRDYLILLAENAPAQKTVDELNDRLLETEEKCMADIVNESQWVDIFPPGFERSLVKLLPRLNIWVSIVFHDIHLIYYSLIILGLPNENF
ncbi:hypothetical protein TNCV_5099911 [Trichonephila clavipes]|uniref:Uncharacterized protein n=1 Tax=Trichonephila clavipes TaxID=2585209 RepID=A0A8X6S063_TRICX|nr:hypothetical protein TNCV_5099911 [Trichonephila clavipes]